MASVRLEQKAIKDPRIKQLGLILKNDPFAGLHRMVLLWEYCVEHETYFIKNPAMVDLISETPGMCESLLNTDVNLAEATVHGIYIRGTEGRIEWLHKKRRAAKKGGKIRSKKAKRNQDGTFQIHDPATIQPPIQVMGKPEAKQASSPVVVAVVESVAVVNNSVREENLPTCSGPSDLVPSTNAIDKKQQAERTKRFVGAYVKAFEGKHGVRPDMTDKKLLGQLANYARNHIDIERACQLIQVFFQIEDRWFKTRCYDFATFLNNQQKIALALDTGKQPNEMSEDEWSKVFGGVPA